MSGIHIAVQRFVKGIGQSQIPSKPGLRSRIGKGKMQPDEFARQAGTRRAQKLNRLLRSDRPCWLVRNKMVAPDGHILVGSGSRMNILRLCLSSHQISDQFVSHRYEAPNEKELKPPGSLKSIVSKNSWAATKCCVGCGSWSDRLQRLAHYVAGPLVPNAWVSTLRPHGLELIPIALGPVGREKP